jgi:hypothetical protein
LLATKHPRLRGELPLVGRGPAVPRIVRLSHLRPDALEVLLRSGSAALTELERLRLRRRWNQLAHGLLRCSYLMGIADSLDTPQRYREFFSSAQTSAVVSEVRVWLDAPSPVSLPRTTGSLELSVGYSGVTAARVRPLRAAAQWDWSEVADRVVDQASDALRRAVLLGGPATSEDAVSGEPEESPPLSSA